jgi:hypothetical protein
LTGRGAPRRCRGRRRASIERIDRTFEARAEREALKRLVKKQQAKIYALENAGMLAAQRTTLAALKDEFNLQR